MISFFLQPWLIFGAAARSALIRRHQLAAEHLGEDRGFEAIGAGQRCVYCSYNLTRHATFGQGKVPEAPFKTIADQISQLAKKPRFPRKMRWLAF
jgi:hypothetical protein